MINIQQFTFNAYQENTYVLYDETGECVIIDPGMYASYEQNEVVAFIKDNKLKPVLLLNTHCHIDHVFGNKFVFDQWGLKPQFHQAELRILHAIPSYAPGMGFRYELCPDPDVFIQETDVIGFGQSKLEVILAPGHSPGHLCFYAKDEQFLIGGDVLFFGSIGRTDLPGGNHEDLLNSIKDKLFRLPAACTVYPGHGKSTSIGYEQSNNPFF